MREGWTHTAALTHRDVEVQVLHDEHKASEQQWIHLLAECSLTSNLDWTTLLLILTTGDQNGLKILNITEANEVTNSLTISISVTVG